MNLHHILLCAAALLTGAAPVCAATADLLPRPQHLEMPTATSGFALERPVVMADGSVADPMLSAFATGFKGAARPGTIHAVLVDSIPDAYDYRLDGFDPEAYSLRVTPDTIFVEAVAPVGLKRAAATLAQLALDSRMIEPMLIRDWPAFKLRGFMHDVGRSFISVDELKKEIDLLSRFKINTFHWHLTENQAWRFAVDRFPQLTSPEATTRYAGRFYTPRECRELEAYAAERGVTVIPEIDMPGHSQAFERAMGHSMQTPEGVAELQLILEAAAEAFPLAPWIHIGGDEVAITYPGFLETMIAKVHDLGRRVVVWNPIHGVDLSRLEGVDMTQMWGTAGRMVEGVANIDCRYNYANHFDTFADIEGIYSSSIYYAPRGNENIAGSISAYWNDRILPDESDIIRLNNFYAATIATAERAWTGGGDAYIEQGGTVMEPGSKRHAQFADWERRFLRYKDTWLAAEPIPYMRQADVTWRIAGPFENGGDPSASFWPETADLSGELPGPTRDVAGAGIYLRHVWGGIVPGVFGNAPTDRTAYAWTWIWSPADTVAGAYVEFHNYNRSEPDAAPEPGCWDRKGSRIWLNGRELAPPSWANAGVAVTRETPLANENAAAREPLRVELRRGWNKVMVKLPYVSVDGIRLNKWMFTFLLTDPEGRRALDCVTYAAEPRQ